MAGPRILIGSSFIDLGVLRSDLEQYVLEIGYEALLLDKLQAPFEDERKLHVFCYRNVVDADVLVYVLGSSWEASAYKEYSLAEKCISAAVAEQKQCYLFLPRPVLSEYQTYLLNRNNNTVRYRYVAHPDIYRLIYEISMLAGENCWQCFDSPQDLLPLLKYEWAATFARLLRQQQQPITNGYAQSTANIIGTDWAPYTTSSYHQNGIYTNGTSNGNGHKREEPIEATEHKAATETSITKDESVDIPAETDIPEIAEEGLPSEPKVKLAEADDELNFPIELNEDLLLQNKFIRHLSQGHQLPIEAIVEGIEAMDDANDLKDYFRTVSEGGNGRKWSFDCIDEPGSIMDLNEIRKLLGREPYELPQKEWKAPVFG